MKKHEVTIGCEETEKIRSLFLQLFDLPLIPFQSKTNYFCKSIRNWLSSSFDSSEMALTIVMLVAVCFVTPTKPAPSVPSNSSLSRTLTVSDAEILVKLLLVPRVNNATEQVSS